jgi:acetylornithine deacetylase/succinyl-diaminopimelate desuccinylase-like protein
VEGFYDDVRPLTDEVRERLARVPYGEEDVLRETGAPRVHGEPGFSVIERIGLRPTLEVIGVGGGHQGEGFKGVIPAEARAKFAARLVVDQDPVQVEAAIRAHIAAVAPDTVTWELESHFGLRAILLDPETPEMRAAARAYERGFGNPPVFVPGGGGIPVVSAFAEDLGLPVVLMGFAQNDDNVHGPNEKLLVKSFHRGIRASVAFMEELAAGV